MPYNVFLLLVQLLSLVQLCNRVDCSTPGSPVLHSLFITTKFLKRINLKLMLLSFFMVISILAV